MCGIVYVQRKDNKPAVKQVLKRYKAQERRGNEGFGYVAVKQSGRVTDLHRYAFEHEVKTKLEGTKHQHILFHHRYPTSTPNVPEAAHPIKVSHAELLYDYLVVHNGVINNDDELKEAHNKLGYSYTTEMACQYRTRKGHIYEDGIQWNDSEALAIELARNIEGITEKTEAKGSIAYVVMQVDKVSQIAIALYFGTNGGNALTFEQSKEYICIASEGGKPINDNICYKMSLPDNTMNEYHQVQLHGAYVPPVRHTNSTNSTLPMGYGVPYRDDEYDDYGRVKHDRLPYPYNSKPGKAHKPSDDDMDISTIEDEIADIDEELIGLHGDIEFATAEGDIEEAEMYRDQLKDLQKRRDNLELEYAKRANATA